MKLLQQVKFIGNSHSMCPCFGQGVFGIVVEVVNNLPLSEHNPSASFAILSSSVLLHYSVKSVQIWRRHLNGFEPREAFCQRIREGYLRVLD